MGVWEVRICAGRLSSRVLAGVYFQSEAEGLSVSGGGSSLGPGPTVGVVAEGRYIAVSTVIIVVVDSKTTEYLHVSCSNLIFLGVSVLS